MLFAHLLNHPSENQSIFCIFLVKIDGQIQGNKQENHIQVLEDQLFCGPLLQAWPIRPPVKDNNRPTLSLERV